MLVRALTFCLALTSSAAWAQPTASTRYTLYVSSESGDVVSRIEVLDPDLVLGDPRSRWRHLQHSRASGAPCQGAGIGRFRPGFLHIAEGVQG